MKLLVPIIILLALAGIALYLYYFNKKEPTNPNLETGSISNTARPSEEESTAGDAQKQANEARQQLDESPTSSQVTPVITFAKQVQNNLEVGAFISGIYEDGGSCVLKAVKGSTEYTKTQVTFKNARSTDCEAFSVPVSELSAGEWAVSVSYSSVTSMGVSEIKKVTIEL